MKTLTIELFNKKAASLILDLEALELIKIIDKSENKIAHKKPSDFFNSLSLKVGSDLLNFVNESRAEWERDI